MASTSSALTYRELGLAKLRQLLDGLGLYEQAEESERLFDLLTRSWGGWELGTKALWPSDISDDGTPFEFSVAFADGRPRVRLLAEAQRPPLSAESNWKAGLELNAQLAELPGVSLKRFEKIQELFAPDPAVPARFAIWHAGTVEPDGSLSFKLYLNPRVFGDHFSPWLVRDALERLDLSAAWSDIAPRLGRRSELSYFSLDLRDDAEARAKVYLSHPGATAAEIDRLTAGSHGYRPGLARHWIETLTGSSGPFDARPVITCHSFREPTQPSEVTVHVPARCYVENDRDSLARAATLLTRAESERLRSGVEALGQRPLEVGRGLVTYVSLRPAANGPRVTAYLAPEAFTISAPRPSARPAARVIPEPVAARPSSPSRPPPRESMVRALGQSGVEQANFGEVADLISHHRAHYAQHRFLARLEGVGTAQQASAIAERLTFFVMCFQDMLRLARTLSSDPEISEFATTHEQEDRGHDLWFLNDLERLGVSIGVPWTFSEAHAPTRDIAYRLIAGVIAARHDATRLSILLALEAAGAEFFGRIIGFLERLELSEGLLYFARSHERIEQSHGVFETDSQNRLHTMKVSLAALSEVMEAVAATFAAMTCLADEADRAMTEHGPDTAQRGSRQRRRSA
jgi:DMATS type aromatic prenyltransferase